MTAVLFTVDTELSPGFHQRGMSPDENLRRNVFGEVAGGAWGIDYQMDRLNAHGLKGVFFVEALCAYAVGFDVLRRIVDAVLTRGHEVQLHLHTEWLKWIDNDPLCGRRGESIADFSVEDQRRLLELGIEALAKAGAPKPRAFRAGNYGANNDTLRALAMLGVRYDSSYDAQFLGENCRIEVQARLDAPTLLDGVVEVPVTYFEDYPGNARHLQLCAVSASELGWALQASADQGRPTAVIVSHSFELLDRKRTRANRILLRRFEALCREMQRLSVTVPSATFSDLARTQAEAGTLGIGIRPLKSNPWRTARRMAEQSLGTLIYDLA